MTLAPRDPDFEVRVRSSFARQRLMATLGASVERVVPGEVAIGFGFRDDLTQQHGFLHAGVMTAIADSACGYAALTVMDRDAGVLAVEFKINLLAPGKADRFVAVARVVRAGRTLVVCTCEVIADPDGARATIALMQGTMMAVRGREGIAD